MRCKKRSYRDKDQALKAMHRIGNKKDGRKKPVRAYQCDICIKWHLTSREIGDMAKEPFIPKLNWSNIIKKQDETKN